MTTVQVHVDLAEGCTDIDEVTGIYTIELMDNVADRNLCDAALDLFHSSIAIGELDDYTIYVTDINGVVLDSRPDCKPYAFKNAGKIMEVTKG